MKTSRDESGPYKNSAVHVILYSTIRSGVPTFFFFVALCREILEAEENAQPLKNAFTVLMANKEPTQVLLSKKTGSTVAVVRVLQKDLPYFCSASYSNVTFFCFFFCLNTFLISKT